MGWGFSRETTLALLVALGGTVLICPYPVVLGVQEMIAVADTIGVIASILVTFVLWSMRSATHLLS